MQSESAGDTAYAQDVGLSIFRLVQSPELTRRAGGCELRLNLPISSLVVAGCAAAPA